MKGIRESWLDFFQPAPSLFDFLISLMLVINFIQETYIKEIFFVFYTLLLLCLTFIFKPKRNYQNIWLGLIAIWSLIGVFIHSFILSKESIVFRYKNMYLMSEGFIYILVGILFLYILIKYTTNIKFLYFLFPVLIMPWVYEFKKDSHFTPFVALFLALLIFFLIKKRYWISMLMFWAGLVYFGLNYTAVLGRFAYKIPVMKGLVKQIIQHPFVGSGFNHTLDYNNMIFLEKAQKWLWRYNDFLNIGAQLGIIASIFCLIFTFLTLIRIKINIHLILAITMILIMSVQSIMFFVDKAVTYIFLTGLFIVSSYKKEEFGYV
jgi:hypothetical protein